MIEFILYLLIFGFIYSQRNQIDFLKKELYAFKREMNLKYTLSKKGSVLYTQNRETPIEKPISKREYVPPQTFFVKTKHTQTQNTFIDSIFDTIKSYFTEGNIAVRIGGVILFFGLAFLVKYASEHSTLSIEMRLLGIGVGGLVVLILGWRLRHREGYYGIILQALGIAIFYLLIFASAKAYLLLPLSFAFILMLIVVIFGAVLAIMQNALPLALFAISGGFVAPILTSDGSGSHVMLFSYYALLNTGIVGIALYRSWRILNLSGFVFTFIIATAWGVLRYEPEFFATTEPFLILFFLFYLAVSILFSFKQRFGTSNIVDASLVFGLPLIAFSLQASLVHTMEHALAYSALSLGTLYIVLYKLLSFKSNMRLLSDSFLALSLVFYTMSIPFAFDDQLTGALWALEASAIIWISLRQNNHYAKLFGVFLQALAIVLYLYASLENHTDIAFINTIYLGYLILIFASFFSSYIFYKYTTKDNSFNSSSALVFLISALSLWLFSGLQEALNMVYTFANVMLVYISISALIFAISASKLQYNALSKALQAYFYLALILFASLSQHYHQYHPFEGIGAFAILLFFATHYFLLSFYNKGWSQQKYHHIFALWLIVIITATELSYQTSLLTQNETYHSVIWGVVLSLSVGILLYVRNFLPQIFNSYKQNYRSLGLQGILIILVVWEIYSFFLDANPSPLAYIPLLNPLDFTQVLGFILLYQWHKKLDFSVELFYQFYAFLLLVFASIVLARSVHTFVQIEYYLYPLAHSMIFQTSLSILWSLIAMSAIFRAKYLQQRQIWITGASLMGLVVVKLFLVELANSGSIERIISFIVVGLLLVLIGYFAPLPPHKSTQSL